MTEATDQGRGPGLSRRRLLGGLTGAAALVGATQTLPMRAAFASTTAPSAGVGDTVVILTLRGGLDSLTALPPLGDAVYASVRPTLAVSPGEATQLDSEFGLHPGLAPLRRWWSAGKLAFVNASGAPFATRSHFQARQQLERAAPGETIRSGWVNRLVDYWADKDAGALSACGIGMPFMPQSMMGPAPVTTMSDLDTFTLVGAEWAPTLGPTLRTLTDGVAGPGARVTRATLDDFGRLAPVQAVPAGGAAAYPGTPLGASMQDAARLIKADVGVRVITVECGDWDTHSGQLTRINALLDDLGRSVSAFADDLGDALRHVTLVTITEFGRRVAENGSGGTDHGHGSTMMLLGGGVRGGRIFGRWPGLAPDVLDAGDLPATSDYRDVLSEVLLDRAGVGSIADIFPGYRPRLLGVTRPRDGLRHYAAPAETAARRTGRPSVTVHLRDHTVRSGHRVHVSGQVRPHRAGHVVHLQLHHGGRWHTVARGPVDAGGRYRLHFEPHRRGRHHLRVFVPPGPLHSAHSHRVTTTVH